MIMDYTDNFWRAFDFKILVDYERAKMFVNGKKIPNPRFSNMYVTSGCNEACRYCEYQEENKKKVIMPLERVLKNIDEARELGVSAIDFCGGGEPALHPDLVEILKYCRSKDIVTGLFTNMAFKNDRLLEAIVRLCSYVRISLDSFNEEKYNLIRRPKDPKEAFRAVMENLKKITALKKKYNSDIIIGAKMLVTKFNYGELEEVVKRSADLGLDSVQIKRVNLFDNLYIGPATEKRVKKIIAELKERYSDRINILIPQTSVLKTRCFTHENHIFIDAFGDVYLCCYYMRRKKSHHLGNIYRKSIRDIWFSARHMEVSENTKIGECNKMDCRWIKFNNLMKPLIYDDGLRQLDFV